MDASAEERGRLSAQLEELHVEGFGRRKRRRSGDQVVACEACGQETTVPIRGRCPRCYRRLQRGRSVLPGARCACCGTDDHRVLRSCVLDDRRRSLCANCHAVLDLTEVSTVEELRALVVPPNERRRHDRRRNWERRVGLDSRRLEERDEPTRRSGEDRRAAPR